MGRLYQIFGFFAVLCLWYYTWQETRGCRHRKALIGVLLCNFFFVWIAYKHISAPHLTYLFLGGVALPALIYGMLFDTDILLVVAATYFPYNLTFPATFGGMATAINGTNIVLAALLVGIIMSREKAVLPSLFQDRATLMVVVFLIFATISFMQGAAFHGQVYWQMFPTRLKWFFTPFFIFLLFRKMVRDRNIIKLLFAVCLVVIIFNIWYGLLEWVNLGFATYSGWRRRLGGINGHPNIYAAFIAFYISLIGAPMLINFRRASVKALIFPLFLALRVIVPTNSRGAWLGLPPAYFAVGFFRGKAFFAAAILLSTLPFFFPGMVPNTMRGRFEYAFSTRLPEDPMHPERRQIAAPGQFLGETKALSWRQRQVIWGGGISMLQARPWLGYGFGVFVHLVGYYTVGQELWGSAHNMWLEIAVEMGLLALIPLFLAFFIFGKQAFFVFKREKDPMLKSLALGYIGMVVALVVVNMTGNRFDAVDLTTPFWILSACIVRLRQIHIREQTLSARHPI